MDAVGKGAGQLRCRLQCQARLAHAAGCGEGQEAAVLEELLDLRQFLLAPDQFFLGLRAVAYLARAVLGVGLKCRLPCPVERPGFGAGRQQIQFAQALQAARHRTGQAVADAVERDGKLRRRFPFQHAAQPQPRALGRQGAQCGFLIEAAIERLRQGAIGAGNDGQLHDLAAADDGAQQHQRGTVDFFRVVDQQDQPACAARFERTRQGRDEIGSAGQRMRQFAPQAACAARFENGGMGAQGIARAPLQRQDLVAHQCGMAARFGQHAAASAAGRTGHAQARTFPCWKRIEEGADVGQRAVAFEHAAAVLLLAQGRFARRIAVARAQLIAPLALGQVKPRVGAFEQGLRIDLARVAVAKFVARCCADRQGHAHRRIAGDLLVAHGAHQPLHQRLRLLQAGVLQDQHEFVAAIAEQAVGAAQRMQHALRHFAQDLVAARMAEGIVDAFEVIDVDDGQGQHAARCARTIERSVEAGGKAAAGEGTRQAVDCCWFIHG